MTLKSQRFQLKLISEETSSGCSQLQNIRRVYWAFLSPFFKITGPFASPCLWQAASLSNLHLQPGLGMVPFSSNSNFCLLPSHVEYNLHTVNLFLLAVVLNFGYIWEWFKEIFKVLMTCLHSGLMKSGPLVGPRIQCVLKLSGWFQFTKRRFLCTIVYPQQFLRRYRHIRQEWENSI